MVTLLSAVQSCTIFLSLFTIICVSALFTCFVKEWTGADCESGGVQVVPDPPHNSYRLGTLCLPHRHWGNK